MPTIQTFTINDQFIAKVQAPTNAYPITKIKVGGPERHCVMIDVYEHSGTAYMAALGYHKKCNLTEDMIRGQGTRNLVNSSLAFVLQQFPKLIGVTLKDDSKVTCGNGVRIPLYYLSLALHGATWYERYFGAMPEDAEQRKKFRAMKAYLRGSMIKLSDFKKMIGVDGDLRFAHLYKECWKAGMDYLHFFALLHKASPDCAVFAEYGGWLERFMDKIPVKPDFMEAYWLIKRKRVSGVDNIDVVDGNGQRGGGIVKMVYRKKKDIVLMSMDEM